MGQQEKSSALWQILGEHAATSRGQSRVSFGPSQFFQCPSRLSINDFKIIALVIQATLPYLAAGAFQGASDISIPDSLRPDFGPGEIDPSRGIATVGAVPFVVNYNVLLETEDLPLARQIARAVSGRGGGLSCVEAMALPHEQGETCTSVWHESFLVSSQVVASNCSIEGH